MTPAPGWDVRIAADVNRSIIAASRATGAAARLARDFAHAMAHLARSGTRAPGVKKLKPFDLWEIRIGDHRAYFCLVPGTNQLAVAALIPKRTQRHRARTLAQIEHAVHRWRDALEVEVEAET